MLHRSSGLAVSFTVGLEDNCTIQSGTSTVHLTGAGTCTVTASQPGDGNYQAAPPVRVRSPLRRPLRASVSPLENETFGDPPFSVSGEVTTNSPGAVSFALGTGSVGCTVTAAGQVTITGAAVGTDKCVIDATLAESANYLGAGPSTQSFNIAKATPSFTFARWTR